LNPTAETGTGAIVDCLVAFAGITELTKRLDVVYIATATSCYGDNMICGKFNIVTATLNAAIAIVFLAGFPLRSGKGTSSFCFPRAAAMFDSSDGLRICLFVFAMPLPYGRRVIAFPLFYAIFCSV